MFRSLIYRTDFGNTIIREEFTPTPTLGPNEAFIFTDFVIPANQPLYLWREDSGSVIPNTEQNVDDWLNEINPPSGDDEVTYNVFTGYTGTTQNTIDVISAETENKINKVTGATGNIPQFTSDGGIEDSGFDANDFLSGISGATPLELFTGYTATTEVRLQDIETDLSTISGQTDQNTTDIAILTGLTVQNIQDILFLSGATDSNTTGLTALTQTVANQAIAITEISGKTDQNSSDIISLSGQTQDNANDIAFISGVTDTKQDQLSAGEGINSSLLSNNDIIQVDLSAFTAIGGLDITLTGSTNAVINDLRAIARGLEYTSDLSANFTVRSLVDKGYVDAVAAGLDLKESVLVATTTGETDIDLTLGTFGGVIDGVALSDGARVLIKNQDSAQEDNGIYIWSAGSSTFARAVDFDNPNVSSGAFTFVETGTTNGGSGWVLVSQDPINIGVTELIFTQFSSTGSLTAGNGINIINGVISVDGNALAGDFINFSSNQFNVTGLTTIADFNAYTGATETRISGIENDITFISGETSTLENRVDNLETAVSGITGGTFVEVDTFTGYTATTDTRISSIEDDITFISGVTDTKLDTSIFTGYTASTQSNELFLAHTGGTNINTVAATAISWNTGITTGSAYNWSGGTGIFILEDGEYEISYNIPFVQLGNNSDRGIGSNIILNNSVVLDNTASAANTTRSNTRSSCVLSTINITLSNGDRLDLVGFRTGQNGVVETSPNVTILIKKKNTIQ